MKITIRVPTKEYGLFGTFGMIADLQLVIQQAIDEHRGTGKPVKVVYNEHFNVTIED